MENPYSCPMANCSLSFDTEDQLSAHKKKHELSLSLTPSAYKNPFLLDQTPTPTQFLSPFSLELQDFNAVNPFDATFRKANSSNHDSNNFLIPESSSLIASLPDSEVLNTPSIVLTSEPPTPISLKPNFPKKFTLITSDNQPTENTDSLPFSPNEPIEKSPPAIESIADEELPSESGNLSSIVSSFGGLSENEGKEKKGTVSKNVLQTSVITSVGNTAVVKSSGVGVPTAVVVTRAPVNSISTLSTSQVSVVAQPTNQIKVQKTVPAVVQPFVGTVILNISLADGQIVQLPVVSNNQPSSTASIAPQVTSTTTSNTKLKLKEVLMQNQKTGVVEKKTTSVAKAKSKIIPYILPDSTDNDQISSSPPSSPLPSGRSNHVGRKRRDTFDDPDEKRKRSLERNRAAATRCREKRKMWITSLEKKADELERTNVHLQQEVTVLRNEVAHLKTLLLAHKDCPVTLQQKASENEVEKVQYTTVRIITSASDDVQRVPNSIEISPPNSDMMEMEIGSVQSSDSSFTSDLSEVSYRER